MGFGYNLPINKKISLKYIFIIVRFISKILSKKKFYCINSINLKNHEYFVTFFYPGERLIFVKSAAEILKSSELISKFSSRDASIIGFCVSTPTKEQFNGIRAKLARGLL